MDSRDSNVQQNHPTLCRYGYIDTSIFLKFYCLYYFVCHFLWETIGKKRLYNAPEECCGSGPATSRIFLGSRIRIKVKSLIRICIKDKIQELLRLIKEPCRARDDRRDAMYAQSRAICIVCGSVVADWHHIYQEQNPDPHQNENRIRIHINVMRIRNNTALGKFQIWLIPKKGKTPFLEIQECDHSL
jgi:hypothetical protein